jgi:hypothetical protein
MPGIARRHTSLLIVISAIVVLAATQVAAQEGARKPGTDGEATTPAGINADTVDGRHAVGPAALPAQRAGKLVATNAQGYLPADIVLKAQNADRLDGLVSTVFARAALLKGAAGAVNEPDNPVHWNQLKGVPAGIADGQVAWGEVTAKPAAYPDADMLDGLDSAAFARTSALGAYATTAALVSDAGAVNEPDNPVHWNQLKGVPAGIADGTDADTTGWVTTTVYTGTIADGGTATYHSGYWPRSSFVQFRILPTDIDPCPELGVRWTSYPNAYDDSVVGYTIIVANESASPYGCVAPF